MNVLPPIAINTRLVFSVFVENVLAFLRLVLSGRFQDSFDITRPFGCAFVPHQGFLLLNHPLMLSPIADTRAIAPTTTKTPIYEPKE